ncbi:unnamed protein product [Durusdinium trenchii]|uniref:J domain-containing protein n=1 Tax=Durusdinium trenchii TaxID=1381693 RepID=A0ABP0IX12_9DINO
MRMLRCAPLLVLVAAVHVCFAWVQFRGLLSVGCTCQSRTARCRMQRNASFSVVQQETARALEVLGLDPSDSPSSAEVKKAFRRKVARLHPDLKGGDSGPEFLEVLDAYAVLTGRQRVSTPAPNGLSGFDIQRTSKGKTDTEREAEFQRPGNWRWDQNTGYNPRDLNEVWDEIGYNPYTGEYREPPPKAEVEEPWVPEPPSAVKPSPQRPKSRPPRLEFGLAQARDLPEPLPVLQILGYLLLAAVCAFFALSPEQLLSEEERAKRLEELERREEAQAQQRQQRAALEILWRQRERQWQMEQLKGFAEYADPIDEEEAAFDAARNPIGTD